MSVDDIKKAVNVYFVMLQKLRNMILLKIKLTMKKAAETTKVSSDNK